MLHWSFLVPQVRVSVPGHQAEALYCLPGQACQPNHWLGASTGPVPRQSRAGHGSTGRLCVCMCVYTCVCVCAREHPQSREGLQHGRMGGQSWASSLLPSSSSCAVYPKKPYLN